MRAYGGRVARLQADLRGRGQVGEPRGRAGREGDLGEAWRLAEDWRQTQGDHGASERIGENVHDPIPEDLEGEVGDEIPEESGSATDEGIPNNEHRPRQILKKARCTKYVIVKGAGWGDGGYSGTPENLAPG